MPADTSVPTAQAVLAETIYSYQCAFGDPPQLIRATRPLRMMLQAEMAPYMVYDAKLPYMPSDEITFWGITVKCDLPGRIVAALAIHE